MVFLCLHIFRKPYQIQIKLNKKHLLQDYNIYIFLLK
nr:MAG TPA: hypothetical protein [Caudoviricetes sp.]